MNNLAGEAADAPAKARQLLRKPAVMDDPGLPASVLLDLVGTILDFR